MQCAVRRSELCAVSKPESAETTTARAQIREILQRVDPNLLAMCDAAKMTFDAKLVGLRIAGDPPQALGELLTKGTK